MIRKGGVSLVFFFFFLNLDPSWIKKPVLVTFSLEHIILNEKISNSEFLKI